MPDFAVRTSFRATDRLSPAFRRMGTEADAFGRRGARSVGMVSRAMQGLRGLLPLVGAGMAVALVRSANEAARSMTRLEVAYRSIFSGDATNQMRFVRQESNRLGVNFERAAGAYRGIAAAAQGTAISNRAVQETFRGVLEGATALQLTGEQTEGALLAISQIISKGRVSMEELRGQLGERIPGAMQIAAQAMGTTTAGLEAMVRRGLSAEEFIPRFAAAMRNRFGPAAAEAARGMLANEERFNNLTFQLKAGVGRVILPALNNIMTALIPLITVIADFMENNKEVISFLIQKAVPVLVAIAGLILLNKIRLQALFAIQTAKNVIGWTRATIGYWRMMGPVIRRTREWAIAQRGLNLAMKAAPLGLMGAAVGALGAQIYEQFIQVRRIWPQFLQGLDMIKNGLSRAGSWIASTFTRIFGGIPAALASALASVRAQIQAIIGWVQSHWGVISRILGVSQITDMQNAVGAQRQPAAPNRSQLAAQQVNFSGELNINNAPPGSTASSSTRGARPINMNLVGQNP